MKMKKLIIGLIGLSIVLGLLGINLSAQNRQNYSMNKTLCAHYVKLSRKMVDGDNLPLAKLYAQKAVQANPWEKAAWANYNDVIQRLADNGDIKDFDTFIEESTAAQKPKADAGAQFEGC
ncbi:MAG: hypothetical protein GXP61_02390 [Epsilonproteobacteria bacterium]|nr:hypothetical protein [Campylobacterota bacterium]